jgi:DNA-binding XRE family transcriptional regulator
MAQQKIEQTATIVTSEPARARAWRESMNLSRRELAELTGWSEQTIVRLEGGRGPEQIPDEPLWTQYRLCCAALAAGIVSFDWEDTVEIRSRAF